jgi:tetratricopeptide (TPR) repeat protein
MRTRSAPLPPTTAATLWLERAAFVALALFLVIGSARTIWETDYWTLLRIGELVTESGPPRIDSFSHTVSGSEWIELRWLYCWMLRGLTSAFGPAGAFVLKCAALGSAFAMVAWLTLRRAPASLAGPILFLAMLASSQRFVVRPELVTYGMLPLYLSIIERHRRTESRVLWALPLLQTIWTNAHTLFALGPAAVSLYALTSLLRASQWTGTAAVAGRRSGVHALIAAVLTVLACLFNPYGVRGAQFVMRLFHQIHGTVFKEQILELKSPFAYAGHVAVIAFVLLAALAVLAAILNARRLDLFETLLCAAMLYLAATAIRNLPLFALVAAPFAAGNLAQSDWLRQRLARTGIGRLRTAGAIGTIAAALFVSWTIVTNRLALREHGADTSGFGIAEYRYPIRAAALLEEHAITGRVFNTMHEGPYLAARGARVFIDPRLEVYGEAFYNRYAQVLSDPRAWQGAVQEFDLRAALVNVTALPFITSVLRTGNWRLVYWDECAALLVRSDTGLRLPAIQSHDEFATSVARLREHLPQPPALEELGLTGRAASPDPYHRVANLLTAFGFPDLAVPLLRDAIRADTHAAGARAALSGALNALGEREASAREAEIAYRQAPNDAEVASAAALGALNTGDVDKALKRLRRALARNPEHALCWALAGEAHLARRDPREAERCFERAALLEPTNPLYASRLAAVRGTSGLPR